MVKALLVADDLQSLVGAGLVVQHLQHLTKAALAQHALHLIAIRDVVTHDYLVVATLIIVPKVGLLQVRVALDFLHVCLA